MDTDDKSAAPYWKFHLYTALLLVNKRISAEATRVLYEGNDFVLLRTNGIRLNFDRAPAFRYPAENKIKSPVLRIVVSVDGVNSHVKRVTSQSLLTTPEGLRSIIKALLLQGDATSEPIRHTFLTLALDFNLKAATRYRELSELMIKPWDMISVKTFVLAGDIKEPIREHLEKSNLEGSFPTDVSAHLAEHNSLAERAFEQGEYDVARWWWTLLDEYWLYVAHLRPHLLRGRERIICGEDNELYEVLRRSYRMCYEGLIKIVKACLLDLRYREVLDMLTTPSLGKRLTD